MLNSCSNALAVVRHGWRLRPQSLLSQGLVSQLDAVSCCLPLADKPGVGQMVLLLSWTYKRLGMMTCADPSTISLLAPDEEETAVDAVSISAPLPTPTLIPISSCPCVATGVSSGGMWTCRAASPLYASVLRNMEDAGFGSFWKDLRPYTNTEIRDQLSCSVAAESASTAQRGPDTQ